MKRAWSSLILVIVALFWGMTEPRPAAGNEVQCRIVIRGGPCWVYPWYGWPVYGYGHREWWYGYGHPCIVPSDPDAYRPRYGSYARFDYGSPHGPAVAAYAHPTEPVSTDYGKLGRDWAQDLRREIITWEKFVAYVKSFILQAPPPARDAFKKGFVSAYGVNAAEAMAKAQQQASSVTAGEQDVKE